jgi:hypothetical protein
MLLMPSAMVFLFSRSFGSRSQRCIKQLKNNNTKDIFRFSTSLVKNGAELFDLAYN